MTEIAPRITRMTYSCGPVRKQPKLGDRRVTKKHGEQIRVFSMIKDHRSGQIIGFNCTGGRQRYEWVSPEEAYRQWSYLKDRK